MTGILLPRAKLSHLLSLADGATFVDRVVMKPQPAVGEVCEEFFTDNVWFVGNPEVQENPWRQLKIPHAPGDVLYVKERVAVIAGRGEKTEYVYHADSSLTMLHYRPARQMPLEAARLFVRVVSVRPERVQDVTEEEARLEGFSPEYDRSNDDAHKSHLIAMEQFWYAWDARNPKHPFASNPWVWRYEFTKTTGGES